LIALPLSSAPAAYLLAQSEGFEFATEAAIGMLAGTASQVVFALCYGVISKSKNPVISLLIGTLGFCAFTALLAPLNLNVYSALIIVIVSIFIGIKIFNALDREVEEVVTETQPIPSWDLPARMISAGLVVFAITASAPIIGAHLAGLLSPFPIFGAILAFFAHLNQSSRAANHALKGLVYGLITPTLFFFTLAITLENIGYPAFLIATLIALSFQLISGKLLLKQQNN
jgi:hypothetical protein